MPMLRRQCSRGHSVPTLVVLVAFVSACSGAGIPPDPGEDDSSAGREDEDWRALGRSPSCPTPSVFFPDDDGDGFGRTSDGVRACEKPPGQWATAGGDCAVDVAVIDYLNGMHPGLHVVWIDAHLDANTPETSPSGNVHGMPVSAILGRAPEPMRPFLGAPIDPVRFRYFGIRIGDDGDWALQRELDLKLLDPEVPIDGPVHIHFDLDVLDPHEFPYVAYPEGGLGIKEAIDLVSSIAREADVVGLTVTEFAPSNEEEAREGSKVIARLCEAVADP